METNIVAVERLKEYSEIEKEVKQGSWPDLGLDLGLQCNLHLVCPLPEAEGKGPSLPCACPELSTPTQTT
jgi:hypothetical protein